MDAEGRVTDSEAGHQTPDFGPQPDLLDLAVADIAEAL
jgi:hypothetical protein